MPFLLFLAAAFVASSFLQRNRWKTWIFGCVILLCVPSLHALYTWCFLLVPFVPFLFSEKPKGTLNILYFIGCVLPFLFFPQFFEYPSRRMTSNAYIMFLSVVLLVVVCLIDTIRLFREWLRQKRRDKQVA